MLVEPLHVLLAVDRDRSWPLLRSRSASDGLGDGQQRLLHGRVVEDPVFLIWRPPVLGAVHVSARAVRSARSSIVAAMWARSAQRDAGGKFPGEPGQISGEISLPLAGPVGMVDSVQQCPAQAAAARARQQSLRSIKPAYSATLESVTDHSQQVSKPYHADDHPHTEARQESCR